MLPQCIHEGVMTFKKIPFFYFCVNDTLYHTLRASLHFKTVKFTLVQFPVGG